MPLVRAFQGLIRYKNGINWIQNRWKLSTKQEQEVYKTGTELGYKIVSKMLYIWYKMYTKLVLVVYKNGIRVPKREWVYKARSKEEIRALFLYGFGIQKWNIFEAMGYKNGR